MLFLIAGMVLGGFARSGLWSVILVPAGYLGLVICVRRALILWSIDADGFQDSEESPVEIGRVSLAARPRPSSGGRRGALRLPG